MGWSEATFTNRTGRKQRVWVKTEAGEPVVEDGRVEMRYSEGEDAKVYNASASNVSLGDAPPAERESKPKPKKTSAASSSFDDSVWKNPAGDRVTRTEVPNDLLGEPFPQGDVVDAWTDGACTGNPGPCGYGVVLRSQPEQHLEVRQYIGIGTNNIAELMAIMVALEEARDLQGPLRIHTDSSYSIGVLTKGWKAKANKELIAAIRKMLDEFERPVQFVKVKGHAGIPLNERADRLAVEAVEDRR